MPRISAHFEPSTKLNTDSEFSRFQHLVHITSDVKIYISRIFSESGSPDIQDNRSTIELIILRQGVHFKMNKESFWDVSKLGNCKTEKKCQSWICIQLLSSVAMIRDMGVWIFFESFEAMYLGSFDSQEKLKYRFRILTYSAFYSYKICRHIQSRTSGRTQKQIDSKTYSSRQITFCAFKNWDFLKLPNHLTTEKSHNPCLRQITSIKRDMGI